MSNLPRQKMEKDMKFYLVGGAVRDWLLGRKPREYDFAFDASTTVFLQRNPKARKVGKSVSVILVGEQEHMPLNGSLAEDLQSRDFTINALALEENGVLHCHPQALEDLTRGILRPASPTSLINDPVRVFRLARLACELPFFHLHPEAVAQMRQVAAQGKLFDIPAERVGRELLKALAAPKPSRWLGTLLQGHCLEPWFMPFAKAAAIPAGPAAYHSGSVLAHTLRIMDQVAGNPLSVWMALCHDIGKTITPFEQWPHHYGHEETGEALAEELAVRLGLSRRFRLAGSTASLLHMKAGMYPMLRPGTRCRLLLEVHKRDLDEAFWPVAEADSKRELQSLVQRELAVVLAVSLPPHWRNQGEDSGRHLHALRAQALKNAAAR